MTPFSRRGKLRHLIHACLTTSFALPVIVQAQQQVDDTVEEVVVTGSYIRNSAFTQGTNVDTVSQVDLFESGAASMGQYIRDLTYTQNTDVVANVLASQDGGQDSLSQSFNLRGLGTSSTLSLVDGVRSLSASTEFSLPEIAINRLEVVLDGGSALYGSDAVAGVVNIIPIKDFDGFRTRSFYQRTEDGALEDLTVSAIWGRSFDNGISYVGALETKRKTPLMQYERPREWTKDDGSSVSGNPGVFRQNTGADPGINLYQPHGGTLGGALLTDPACGTYNENAPAHGQGKFNTPSGVPVGSFCRFEYTKQFAYATESVNYGLYNSIDWEATDWLRFNVTLNNSLRNATGRTTSTTAVNTNNRDILIVRADHPANPFGFDVSPYTWRPITESYTHRPSHLEDSGGSRAFQSSFALNRLKFQADFEISDSWNGYAYYSKQESKSYSDSYSVHLGKLQLGLEGLGGPNGDEYWNPFGTADPRSPDYVEGVTSNSKEITEWLFDRNKNNTTGRDYLDIFEITATGDLFDLPAGTVQMAAGFQWRDLQQDNFANPFDVAGFDYNTVWSAERPKDTSYQSEVRAVFMEFEAPLLETVDMQLAVRHEQFTTFGLDATTPKIALRWEAIPSLAIRASWGESFLAPTPTQSRPFIRNESCGELFSGQDKISGTQLTGATVCSSGNPNLGPETSEIKNIGLTWAPTGTLDGLELSLDYQEIEYTDRIRSLTSQDTADLQFQQMLAATGIAESAYDSTPGTATRIAANGFLASVAGSPGVAIERDAEGRVTQLFTQSQNISSNWVDVLDFKARYTYSTDNWGTFSTQFDISSFLNYEVEGQFGGVVDVLGFQNFDTSLAPPLPKYKANLRVNWFRDNQSASISVNRWDDVTFDALVIDRYNDGWTAPPGGIIEAETRVNARYAIVIDDYFNSEFTISAGVNNLFEVVPQRLPISGGFESRLSTPWGRQFWLSVDWTPGF